MVMSFPLRSDKDQGLAGCATIWSVSPYVAPCRVVKSLNKPNMIIIVGKGTVQDLQDCWRLRHLLPLERYLACIADLNQRGKTDLER